MQSHHAFHIHPLAPPPNTYDFAKFTREPKQLDAESSLSRNKWMLSTPKVILNTLFCCSWLLLSETMKQNYGIDYICLAGWPAGSQQIYILILPNMVCGPMYHTLDDFHPCNTSNPFKGYPATYPSNQITRTTSSFFPFEGSMQAVENPSNCFPENALSQIRMFFFRVHETKASINAV